MPKDKLDGLPLIDVLESENITVAVKPDDLQEGDEADPEQHPIAIALRRQRGIDDARVSKREVLIRRGDQWFRYGAPKRVSLAVAVKQLPFFDTYSPGFVLVAFICEGT